VEPASASARKQQHFQLKSGKRVRVPNERTLRRGESGGGGGGKSESTATDIVRVLALARLATSSSWYHRSIFCDSVMTCIFTEYAV
jgi:hypothetical protein